MRYSEGRKQFSSGDDGGEPDSVGVDLRRAVLYSVSGGFLIAAFGLAGAAAAQAAPPKLINPGSGEVVKTKTAPAVKKTTPTPKPTPPVEHRSSAPGGNDDKRPINKQQPKSQPTQVYGPFAPSATDQAKKKPTVLSPDQVPELLGGTKKLPNKAGGGDAKKLPNTAGGGGVAITSDQGPRDAKKPKVKLPNTAGGGGVAVSDQLGEARRTSVHDQAAILRRLETDARHRAAKGKTAGVTPSASGQGTQEVKKPKKKLPNTAGGGGVALSDQLGDARRTSVAAAGKKNVPATTGGKTPPGSVSACAGGALAAVVSSAGAKGCLVVDSRGLGWSTSERVGLGAGIGASGSLGVEASSANIEDLAGESVSGGVAVHAGVGGEVSGSVTKDGKNVSGGASVGVGVGGKGYLGPEFTQTGRIFDWPQVSAEEQAEIVRTARKYGGR